MANPSNQQPKNKGQHYTVGDLAFIEENYGKMEVEEIAKKLERTVHSIWNQAQKLGVADNRSESGWSADQDQVLINHFPCSGAEKCRQLLLDIGHERTLKAVEARSQKLGLRRRNQGSVFTFQEACRLPQSEFFRDIAATYKNRTGKELTYTELTKIAYVSHSRVQKWFAPGSGQQPLGIQLKHYLWLVVRSFQSYSLKNNKSTDTEIHRY
jgi:hypothetical protein